MYVLSVSPLIPGFQAEPSILDPIRAIFDDLGSNRHFGPDLDLQDQARDWPGGPGPGRGLPASPWPGTSQVLPTPGGRNSGRLGLSVRTWLAEAATAADLKGGSGGRSPPRKKFELFCDCPKSARLSLSIRSLSMLVLDPSHPDY